MSASDIGNRTTAASRGDQWGARLRYRYYNARRLNRYLQRTVPESVAAQDTANSNATATRMNSTPSACSGLCHAGSRHGSSPPSRGPWKTEQAFEFVLIVTLLALFLLGACCQKRDDQAEPATKAEVVQLISSVEPWRANGGYSEKAWDRAMRVAGILQKSEPDIVGQALDEYVSSNISAVHGDYEENSKPFLMLRLMFELPQTNATGSEAVWLRVWRYSGSNPPAASWPIGWTNGRPYLLEPWQGSYGRPYAARAEYDYFRRCFRLRKLSPRLSTKSGTLFLYR
jgi:hypothetical protein